MDLRPTELHTQKPQVAVMRVWKTIAKGLIGSFPVHDFLDFLPQPRVNPLCPTR
jgi:hypothetical protein